MNEIKFLKIPDLPKIVDAKTIYQMPIDKPGRDEYASPGINPDTKPANI